MQQLPYLLQLIITLPTNYAQHPPQPFDLPTNLPQFITNPEIYIPQGSSHPKRHHFYSAYNISSNSQPSDHFTSQQHAPIFSHTEPHLTSVNPVTKPKIHSHGTNIPASRGKNTAEIPPPKSTCPASNLPARKQHSIPTFQQATFDSHNGTGESDC